MKKKNHSRKFFPHQNNFFMYANKKHLRKTIKSTAYNKNNVVWHQVNIRRSQLLFYKSHIENGKNSLSLKA